jgi:hypothetical protein
MMSRRAFVCSFSSWLDFSIPAATQEDTTIKTIRNQPTDVGRRKTAFLFSGSCWSISEFKSAARIALRPVTRMDT